MCAAQRAGDSRAPTSASRSWWPIPSTVSRLTQTLVGLGMLQSEAARRAYRLAPAVLSLAHAMRTGSRLLSVAAPLMRRLAERERINVGLAAPDRDEMVYLESIRYARKVAFRNVVSRQRVPMELTSLGRAYLSTLPASVRQDLDAVFQRRRQRAWPTLRAETQVGGRRERTMECRCHVDPRLPRRAGPAVPSQSTSLMYLASAAR